MPPDITMTNQVYQQSFIDAIVADDIDALGPVGCILKRASLATSDLPLISTPTLVVLGEADDLVYSPVVREDLPRLCDQGYVIEHYERAVLATSTPPPARSPSSSAGPTTASPAAACRALRDPRPRRLRAGAHALIDQRRVGDCPRPRHSAAAGEPGLSLFGHGSGSGTSPGWVGGGSVAPAAMRLALNRRMYLRLSSSTSKSGLLTSHASTLRSRLSSTL